MSDVTTTEASEWKPLKSVGFMAHIGPLLSKRDGDKWIYALATDERHQNSIGFIHGGALATFADNVMSHTAWEAADRQPIVTVHMDLDYISAGKAGDFLEARAEIVSRKGSMVFVEGRIVANGDIVVRASCVMKVIKPR